MSLKNIETNYDGHRFRSRTEARWAVFFNCLGWRYEYEVEGFVLDGEAYLPDFLLPDIGAYLEVKGQEPDDRETRLAAKLSEASGLPVLLAIGAPKKEADQLFRFVAGLSDPEFGLGVYQDRRNEGEFWLMSSDAGFATSIGPQNGPRHDRYPIIGGVIEKAFAAAASARFEYEEKG